MSRIFISYRRDDSAGYAGRLADDLVDHFGSGHVFVDVQELKPGEDYVDAIQRAIASCDAVLVVIGRRWLTATDESGRRRLDDPDDLHCLEIATALARDVRVIPVLVEGGRMPRLQDLPDGLRLLVRRQACAIDDARWRYDVQRLIAVLEDEIRRRHQVTSGADRRQTAGPGPGGAGVAACWITLAWLLAAAIGEAGYVVPRQSIGPIVVSIPWLFGAALGAFVMARTLVGAAGFRQRLLALAVAAGLVAALIDAVIYTELRTGLRPDLASVRSAILMAGTSLGPRLTLDGVLLLTSGLVCSVAGGLFVAAVAGKRGHLTGASGLLIIAVAALLGGALGIGAQAAVQYLPPWPDKVWSAWLRFAIWSLTGVAVVCWRLRPASMPAEPAHSDDREPSPI
jgi:hypothetical protein